MENRPDEPTPEELKKAFIKRLSNIFNAVLDARGQVMVLGMLDNLSKHLEINSTFRINFKTKETSTKSKGIEQSKKVHLSKGLSDEASRESRAKILLGVLKEDCKLEEEYLVNLR